jgi:molybdopterin-binding protein
LANIEEIVKGIVDAAIKVHTALGVSIELKISLALFAPSR